MNSKQREKLQRISAAITVTTLPSGVRLVSNTMSIEDIKQIIDECLAEPLRNCDVGSPIEQSMRFRSYCLDKNEFNTTCFKCPLYKKRGICEFFWSQMPYEEVKE